MKRSIKNILAIGTVILTGLFFVSCEGDKPAADDPDTPENPENPDKPDTPSDSTTTSDDGFKQMTFIIGPIQGDSQSQSISPKENWIIKTKSDPWFGVHPSSGYAGETKNLVVDATRPNQDIKERVGNFEVKTDSKIHKMYVIQDGKEYLEANKSVVFQKDQSTKDIVVKTNRELKVDVSADWIKVSVTNSDPQLLEDGVTYSKYNEAKMTITVPETSSESKLQGEITISAGRLVQKVKVTKLTEESKFTADFSKTFYRRSSFVRYTATWCGNCPTMAKALQKAMEDMPDRIVPMSMYGDDSGSFQTAIFNAYANKFNITGFPTSVMNDYAYIYNLRNSSTTVENIKNVATETAKKYPSKTALAGTCLVQDGKINAELTIAAKETGDYRISVLILENKVNAKQTGASSNYEHNYIVRDEVTLPVTVGEYLPLTANKTEVYLIDADVPSTVKNADNISIVAYISIPGAVYTVNIPNVDCINAGSAVDNIIVIDANSETDFKYEE